MHGLEVLIAINKNPKLLKRGLDCQIHLPRPKDLLKREPLAERIREKVAPGPKSEKKPKARNEKGAKPDQDCSAA